MRQQMIINSKLHASDVNLHIVFRYTHNVSERAKVLFIINLFYILLFCTYLKSSDTVNTKYINVLHSYAYYYSNGFIVCFLLFIAMFLCLGASLSVMIGQMILLGLAKCCVYTLIFCLLSFKCTYRNLFCYILLIVLYYFMIFSGFSNYNVNNGKCYFGCFCVVFCYNDR